MKEFLCRAKDINRDDWVYGYYCFTDMYAYNGYTTEQRHYLTPETLIVYHMREINKDTVCKFSGAVDKTGKDVYAHDVIQDSDEIFEVFYHEVYMAWMCGFPDGDTMDLSDMCGKDNILDGKIIGNTVDNPELTASW